MPNETALEELTELAFDDDLLDVATLDFELDALDFEVDILDLEVDILDLEVDVLDLDVVVAELALELVVADDEVTVQQLN